MDPPGGVYRNDMTVDAAAVSSPGWTFLGWTGDFESTSPAIRVPMEVPRSIQAIFGTTVSSGVTGHGTVLVHPTLGAYPFGSAIRFAAIPESGNAFSLWGGSASGNVNPLVFTITNPTPSVAALFSPLPTGRHALTVIPNGHGSVSVSPRANSYANGETVVLRALPDGESRFLGWSGDAASDATSISLTMESSRVIMANFTGGDFTVHLSQLSRLPEGIVTFTISGEPSKTLVVEVSNDLHSWAVLRTLPNPNGVVSVLDSTATNWTARFYRAWSP